MNVIDPLDEPRIVTHSGNNYVNYEPIYGGVYGMPIRLLRRAAVRSNPMEVFIGHHVVIEVVKDNILIYNAENGQEICCHTINELHRLELSSNQQFLLAEARSRLVLFFIHYNSGRVYTLLDLNERELSTQQFFCLADFSTQNCRTWAIKLLRYFHTGEIDLLEVKFNYIKTAVRGLSVEILYTREIEGIDSVSKMQLLPGDIVVVNDIFVVNLEKSSTSWLLDERLYNRNDVYLAAHSVVIRNCTGKKLEKYQVYTLNTTELLLQTVDRNFTPVYLDQSVVFMQIDNHIYGIVVDLSLKICLSKLVLLWEGWVSDFQISDGLLYMYGREEMRVYTVGGDAVSSVLDAVLQIEENVNQFSEGLIQKEINRIRADEYLKQEYELENTHHDIEFVQISISMEKTESQSGEEELNELLLRFESEKSQK